jgi:hypothetical protein
VPLAEGAQEKTTFARLFEFTVMPFGLQGAPATFQRLMDRLIRWGGGVVRPEKSKLTAVEALDVPKTKKDVRTFLGITGYYR